MYLEDLKPLKSKSGIWFSIMEVLAKLAVISNAFLIAFTSDFIQKLVYKFHYGEVEKESFEKLPNLKRLGRWLAT